MAGRLETAGRLKCQNHRLTGLNDFADWELALLEIEILGEEKA